MAFCADVTFPEAELAPRRRQYPRYTLRSLAYVKLDQGNGGIVRDLTESGIAIQAVAPMQPGQEISLRFDLLSPRVRVETRGRVAWADSNGQSGIEFDPLPVRLQKCIRDWLLLQMLSAASVSGRDWQAPGPSRGKHFPAAGDPLPVRRPVQQVNQRHHPFCLSL